MTARVDLHIVPGSPYTHAITFTGPVTLPTGAWRAQVRSKGHRPLLAPVVDVSALASRVVTLRSSGADTEGLVDGVGEWTLYLPDDTPWITGEAVISADEDFTGAETTTVPTGDFGPDETGVTVTVQGVPIPGAQGTPGHDGIEGADVGYVHVQSDPVATWTMPHPFATVLAITVVDSADNEVEGDENLNGTTGTAVVAFGASFSGKAYLVGIPAPAP